MKIQKFIFMIIAFVLFSKISNAQNSEYYNIAIKALANKDTSTAIKQFERSIKRNRDHQSYWELAKIYNKENTLTSLMEARLLIKEAIKWDEENINYRLLFGELLEKLFKINFFDKDARSRAFIVYEDILEIKFNTPQAHFRLAELYKEDFYEYYNSVGLNAKELDYKFNIKNPNDRDANREYYNEFLNSLMRDDQITKHDYSEMAKEFYEKSKSHFINTIKFDKTKKVAYLNLGMLYDFNDEAELGIKVITDGLSYFPKDDSLYQELAYLYYRNKEFEKCEKTYNTLFEILTKEKVLVYNYKTVEYLFDTKTQNEFDNLPTEKKKAFIEKFWEIKDPINITEYNEKKLEHYSRVYYANYNYTNKDLNEIGWQTERGNIVIRYGIPNYLKRIRADHTVREGVKGFFDSSFRRLEMTPRSEIWDYGDKIFSFVDLTFTKSYKLITKSNLSNNYKIPFYSDSHVLSTELKITEPENYTPHLKGPAFNVNYYPIQLKGVDGTTDFYISYAVDEIDGEYKNEKFINNHKVLVLALDKYFNKVKEKLETVNTLELSNKIETEETNYFSNTIGINLKPGPINLSFEIERENDNGISSNHGKMEIKNFSTKKLSISDLVLASDVKTNSKNTNTLKRGIYNILPNATKTFNEESNPFIYYEIYNLQKGENNLTNFTQEITIRKKENNEISEILNSILDVVGLDFKGNKITLKSNYSTIEENPQIYLQLDLGEYEEGEYVITINIKDEYGKNEYSKSDNIIWEG